MRKMRKTVVIDIVGLSEALIGEYTPFLTEWKEKNHLAHIRPMLPAVTTAVQSSYLTGLWPSDHGIVGNGWYDRLECETKFWQQSDKLVAGEKIWEKARKSDPSFTCSKMFWWYNMYSSADYSVTPRPQYHADGVKEPDCYSYPASLRDELQQELGRFPLFNFWGPNANIKSSRWIADASIIVDHKYDPTLTLIYLPHLDYGLQKYGPDFKQIGKNLREIDSVIKDLVSYYKKQGASIVLLSEYGITGVSRPIHLNRLFRRLSLIQVREEEGLELLDPGASRVFALADHQVAHIYINDESCRGQVKDLLKQEEGVELILEDNELAKYHIDHPRAGDLVVVADPDSWFTYYYWLDDTKAPDFARLVEIHRKPGYDPVEMFMTSRARAAYQLARKKLGFRYLMDIVPLDATLVKGSHGRIATNPENYPVFISELPVEQDTIEAVKVHDLIWNQLNTLAS